ncbi:nuclear transport factor 2 family protein [Lentzea sp. NPDC051208]|uniref:nuclear transport factor 2 family protein n=1 Tax=Lentzea sp. NPDC051208 TaxID=3154642 RepID=UPI003423DC9F
MEHEQSESKVDGDRRQTSEETAAGTTDSTAELIVAERRLQSAQLSGDVAVLDELLDDRLIFTSGPDGRCYGKHDDLDLHRSGRQVITRLVEEDLTVLVEGRTGVTLFLGVLEGSVRGVPFAARMRYTRTWFYDGVQGWRLLAGHASAI